MADGPKSFFLSSEIHEYVIGHGTPPDEILRDLATETKEKIGAMSIMQIAPEQGAFMQLLVEVMGARNAVEIGTFTGYSALCIARGLPEDGQLLCCDTSEEWTSVGVPFWERAGVRKKIELTIGPAIDTLRALPEEEQFDIAFIDADKPSYRDYFEALIPRLRRGGLILVDNVLWAGAVVNPEAKDENTLAIRAFNDHVRDDAPRRLRDARHLRRPHAAAQTLGRGEAPSTLMTSDRVQQINEFASSKHPGLVGVEVLSIEPDLVVGRLPVTAPLVAGTGFLWAPVVITLADWLCAAGIGQHLPDGASFTTLEIKTNFIGTVREGGAIVGRAKPVHIGRTTQVWDVEVANEANDKTIALFRCTQMVLAPRT